MVDLRKEDMKILIAESKTMTGCSLPVSEVVYSLHSPAFGGKANDIMKSLEGMTAEQLAEKVKISLPMSRKLYDMIYDFPNKSRGSKAIDAFTGVVFRAFDYPSLDDQGKSQTQNRVRIISSLYGWLQPEDIIKAYRFDFTTPLAPGNATFSSFWRESVTNRLIAELKSDQCGDILNLLPADAAKCIDWNLIKPYSKVWKADFREVNEGGIIKTPNAGKLKTLRGKLLRQIIVENITSQEALMNLSGDDYMADGRADSSGNIIFHTA